MTATGYIRTTIIDTYYEILQAGPHRFDRERLRSILASDLVFEGPIAGRRVGAEPFLQGVSGFIAATRQLKILQLLVAGSNAAALYDAELASGTLRFAEFFEFDNSVITSLRLVFDPHQYRRRGGR